MKKPSQWTSAYLSLAALAAALVKGDQCPWGSDLEELHSACVCSINNNDELSLQCSNVEFPVLITVLRDFPGLIDVLYISNSSIPELPNGIFRQLTIHNLQLSRCGLKEIEEGAFQGQDESLKNLNLQDNLLTAVPTRAIKELSELLMLDLSSNKIMLIEDDAFTGLSLLTLKLAENNLTISRNAFRGLDDSLKNLNLKGTRQREIPEAVRALSSLAFLDLAQNNIRKLDPQVLSQLDSLTALNLERNIIQSFDPDTFDGINDTLSSLSLLNNLITIYPVDIFSTLGNLKVLDIGFNLLTQIPDDAFKNLGVITLLAVDGNPLSTLPYSAFSSVKESLRGLSLGGRFLACDCRVKWIAEWIRDIDLQVTSRERNPQFCGSPAELRSRSFYQISPDDLKCLEPEDQLPTRTLTRTTTEDITEASTRRTAETAAKKLTTTTEAIEEVEERKQDNVVNGSGSFSAASIVINANKPEPQRPLNRPAMSRPTSPSRANPPIVTGNQRLRQRPRPRPNLLQGAPLDDNAEVERDVIVKEAFLQDSSVVIQWDSDTTNILGFRVVYRLFGENTFQPGPPLDPNEREFKIKNVPSQACIIVCVVSLEERNVSPDTVPFKQCREIRTNEASGTGSASSTDKIIIGTSAAICGTVVIAVVVFIACTRKKIKWGKKDGLPAILSNGTQTTTTTANSIAGGPTASLAGIGINVNSNQKDWDQLSMYSARSVGRS
ncbi:hypothetical protein QYM36_002311, partial [Artemia franciscana]